MTMGWSATGDALTRNAERGTHFPGQISLALKIDEKFCNTFIGNIVYIRVCSFVNSLLFPVSFRLLLLLAKNTSGGE